LQVHHAAVVSALRRRGIGRALMDAAVTWAEELGIGHVATAALPGSREANRFMARLALGPQAVLRIAPTPAVRAMLTTRNPGARQVTQVLAVRRSLRHARSMSRSV
jgi:GNAT superfamily N-acetyltransferase